MWKWIKLASEAIPVDIVPPQHYFMECLDVSFVVWAIRLICVLIAAAMLVIYRNMKKNSGE